MTDEFTLYPETVDADVALITAYLARELSLVQVVAVQDRLATDSAFLNKVRPIIDGWLVPGPRGASVWEPPATSLLSATEIERGWNRAALEAGRARPEPHEPMSRGATVAATRSARMRRLGRLAAVIAIILFPLVTVAQVVVYVARHDGAPGHGIAKRLAAPFVDDASPTEAEVPPAALPVPAPPSREPVDGRRPAALANVPRRNARAGAQEPRRVGPGPATGQLREEFVSVTSVRELRNRTVLLTDWSDNRIVVADFARNAVVNIGRTGGGPGEYVRVTPLLPLGGDSALMIHASSRRWTIIAGAMSGALSTLAPDDPLVAFMVRRSEFGTDAAGHVLTTVLIDRRPGALRDSSVLVLATRGSARLDTIDVIDVGPAPKPPTSGPRSVDEVRRDGLTVRAYDVYDLPVLASDGWVAVVRMAPYRVDWRTPQGRWIRGAPIPDRPVRVDDREKAALTARLNGGRNSPVRVITDPNNAVTGTGVGTGPGPTIIPSDWPETVPPFATVRPFFTHLGELVVRRNATADLPNALYDVIDRQGRRTHQLLLGLRQRVLGFGVGAVYLVTTDADDIQRVSRHAWPVR